VVEEFVISLSLRVIMIIIPACFRTGFVIVSLFLLIQLPLWAADVPPDLTKGGIEKIDRKLTYSLGATGLRGWIYTHPEAYIDSLQGRTTAASRQILVTHVGDKSPADGVLKVNDLITGVSGKPFSDDARKAIAFAIQDAETEAKQGVLTLTRWRAGKTEEVTLKLRVMGSYSATAPYDCPKSQRILADACKMLDKEPLTQDLWGAINGLAMMASGDASFLPRIKEFAHQMAPPTLKIKLVAGGVIWDWSYKNLFLCEYYLLTRDPEVAHGIREYTLAMAKGQGVYGTFGHGISGRTVDGKLHGPVPSYGPMNEAGLIANLSIVLGKKCGVEDPEVDAAIKRGSAFFAYYVDKGSIPYGEHEPWPYHENNGKVSMAAWFFGLQGDRPVEARFFSKMALAGFKSRECGHTGQGFSYLWSALGANAGGPAAAAAFVKECSWHLDLERRSDGTFVYDGGEQYGPGETADNTYFGESTYDGLSPTASYVLTYSLPLKKLYITGRDADEAQWLDSNEITATIASGHFDLARKKMTPSQLVAAFSDWSPIVRGWAADELATRPEAMTVVPKLITMAGSKDAHRSQAACETLGLMKCAEAIPTLVNQLSHQDRWVRYKAAQAIKLMGGMAQPAIPSLLAAVARTAEPLSPINWEDPIQLTHGQIAAALFDNEVASALQKADPKLLHPAIRILSQNPAGMARATLEGYFSDRLTEKDVGMLAADLVVAIKTMSPADTMFADEIRLGALKALTKYHYQEAIAAGVYFATTQTGWHSETRTGEIMTLIASYGSAARSAIPGLKKLVPLFKAQVTRGEFPAGEISEMRIKAVTDAITAIEAAKTQPSLRSISPGRSVGK
jgi:HEAT repeat protein